MRKSITRAVPAAITGRAALSLLLAGYLAMTLLVATSTSEGTAAVEADHSTSTVAAGADIWRSEGCIACHSLYGLGGHSGPDLTSVVSRLGVEGVAAVVEAGGERMPAFALAQEDLTNLAAWLAYIDRTGTYPLPAQFEPGYGDIH